MTTYYVDNSSSAASDGNAGTSAAAPLLGLQAVNRLKLQPGDVVAFKAGTTYSVDAPGAGALKVTAVGSEAAPVTFTAYGTGPAPVINNTADGYSDAVMVSGAKYVVIDGLKLADAGQAGVNVTRTSSHITIRNVEALNVGEGVMLVGTDNLVTHSYFHDLNMVKNTAGIFDDDYGAVGIMISNSNNEVSYTKIVNARAASYDYGFDGGGIDLYGTLSNIRIHDNWVENSVGFLEAGASGSTVSNVSIVNNVSYNNGEFLTLHNGGGNFSSNFANVDAGHNTIVNDRNATNSMANVFLDAAAKAGQLDFHDNTIYLKDGDSFFKQQGGYHHDNVFYRVSNATHLYNNWGMTLNAGERFATLTDVPGQSVVAEVMAQSGGAGASFASAGHAGLASASASPEAASAAGPAVARHADLDGDATSDIVLQNGGTVVAWSMANGVYRSGHTITSGAAGFAVVGTGDFNGDGTSDLLLQDGGTVLDWIMKDGAYQAGHAITSGAAGYAVRATGDFDGDGTTDIALQNGGTVVVWTMKDGLYRSGNVVTSGAEGFTVVASGDFDGDGTSDLLLQNGGTVVEWIMKDGAYREGHVLTSGAAGFAVKGAGDFDGDGSDDVVLQDGGTVVDWIMKGGAYQAGHVVTTGAAGFDVRSVGDFDGDGTADLVLQNGGTVVDWIMKDGLYSTGHVVTDGAAGFLIV